MRRRILRGIAAVLIFTAIVVTLAAVLRFIDPTIKPEYALVKPALVLVIVFRKGLPSWFSKSNSKL
jgi:hypothetical protein